MNVPARVLRATDEIRAILPTAFARLDVAPDARSGLLVPSQVLAHRISSVRREKIGPVSGRADDATMVAASRAPVVFFGLA
jgi:mRNA interferase MazF